MASRVVWKKRVEVSSIAHLRRRAALWGALLAALGLGLGPGAASAISFDLDVEFDTGQTGSFAHVTIEQDVAARALDFRIELGDALGDEADLHEFYFNLLNSFDGVAISTDDAPATPYTLSSDPPILGGAGSDFYYGVNFGDGAGGAGNGVLAVATFTLTAGQPLSITDLLENSFASGDSIEIQFAAHVQGTDLFVGATSETVGGVVPEPSATLLLALGLVGIAAGRRRRARERAH